MFRNKSNSILNNNMFICYLDFTHSNIFLKIKVFTQLDYSPENIEKS